MSYRNYISGNKGIVFYPSTSIFLLEIRVIDWLFKNFSHGENLVDSKVGPKSTIITLHTTEGSEITKGRGIKGEDTKKTV